MEFNKLKNSIALNANEEPSIYSAVCMIETLFRDIQDESGVSIQNNPIGDENLPTKLIWLCRAINNIYKSNRAEFDRNTDRLDEKMQELGKMEEELVALSEIAQKLADVKKHSATLEEKLEGARNDKREFDILSERCSAAERELSEIVGFDKEAAQKKLYETDSQISRLKADNEGLIKALEGAEEDYAAAKATNAEISGRYESVSNNLSALEEYSKSLRDKIGAASDDIQRLESENSRLSKEKNELISRRAVLEAQKNSLIEDKENYCGKYISPLENEIEKLRSEIANSEEVKSRLGKESKEATQRKDDLTFQIALVSTEIDKAKTECSKNQECLKGKNEELELVRQKREELAKKLESLADGLEKLQNEASEIENNKLPQARSLVKQRSERSSELKEQLDVEEEKINKFNGELPALEAELAAKREIYGALTASYNIKSNEIKDLEGKVKELSGKTDEEKHNSYKRQLEDSIKRLAAINEECENLKEEIQREEQAISEAEAEQRSLKRRKSEHEDAKVKIDALLKELQPIATDEYLYKVYCAKNRLAVLSGAHEKLVSSLSLIRDTLEPQQDIPDDNITKLESLSLYISKLDSCIENLRKALINCSDSVKMEEK